MTAELDWPRAAQRLLEVETQYRALMGMPGVNVEFTLRMVIDPLRVRFNCGERTAALHREIMEIAR